MDKIVRLTRAITRAILSPTPILLESMTRVRAEVTNIVEEMDFSNPITLMPEVPVPIDPSDLAFEEPLGYMWSDGTMTETQDRNSRVIKKFTKWDEWIKTETPSAFNTLIDNGDIPEKKLTSDTYIL